MKTTTYRGLTIEHPTLKRTEVQDVMDYLQTTFRVVEIDNDCISTLDGAKKIIDEIYDEMHMENKGLDDHEKYEDIYDYIETMMSEV
jgi:hypothetical protein